MNTSECHLHHFNRGRLLFFFLMAHKELIEYLLCLILLDKPCAIKIFQDLCECQQC